MKEASGELSMTAVAVVAIAAIGVLFTTLIWPAIQNNIQRQTYCSQAFGCTTNNAKPGTVNCSYYDADGAIQSINCPNDAVEFNNGGNTNP